MENKDLGDLRFFGDIEPQDWVRWFGMSFAAYTEPIRLAKEKMTEEMTRKNNGIPTHPARCDLVREVFNNMVDQESSPSRIAEATARFYSSDYYDRNMALDMMESGYLHNSARTCWTGNWEGESHQAFIKLLRKEFTGYTDNISIYVHGCGHCEYILGMSCDAGRDSGFSYIANDVYSPTRGFLVEMMQKYTDINLSHQWIPPYDTKNRIAPNSVFGVHSSEVLEHIPNPAHELQILVNGLKSKGYLCMSTFFNDMNGHDPQHLVGNNVFQDNERWFKVLEDMGLRLVWRDPRGVPKIWQKMV